MTPEELTGLGIALVLMFIGFAGSLLPGIPSTPVVLITALAHRWYFGDHGPGWFTLGMLTGLALLSLIMDYLASIYGAKKLGATKRGMIGAIVGAVVGLFFNLPGIILGPFIGATLLEMIGGRDLKASSQAGLGAMIGLLAGALGKAGCCLVMIILFTVNVLYRCLSSAA